MKRLFQAVLIAMAFFAMPQETFSQSIGIGTTTPDNSALLDINSNQKGFLPPRMTTVQRDAIASPAKGLMVFVTNDSSFYFYDGSWRRLVPADDAWAMKGNSGTDSAMNFIGTRDNKPLLFKVNNTQRMQLDNTGRLILNPVSNSFYIGKNVGLNNTGGANYFVGIDAGSSNTTGGQNFFSGGGAGKNNTTGSNNFFIGYASGLLHVTGSSNFFIGAFAGTNDTASNNNFFIGQFSGQSNTSGSNNHFSGNFSGRFNTTGSRNYFSGFSAGNQNTTGNENYFSGYFAGFSNSTGSNNYFNGNAAGFSNRTSNQNHFAGFWAGYLSVSGDQNHFDGYAAGINNHGSENHFSGYFAGSNNVGGSRNTIIGHNANVTSDSLVNAGAIGYNAMVSQNNSFVIGGIDEAAVNVGIGTTAPQSKLDIFDPASNTDVANFRSGGGYAQTLVTEGDFRTDLGSYNGGGYVGTNSPGDFHIRTNANTHLSIIDNTGHIGIGTTNPQTRLDVNSEAPNSAVATFRSPGGFAQINITEGNRLVDLGAYTYGGFVGTNSPGDFMIRTRGNGRIFVTDSLGYVAINHFNPTEQLDVNGNIKLSGIIKTEAVQAATLLNGWTDLLLGYNTAGYYKDKEGVVHLQGVISFPGNTVGSIIFNLPADYCPPAGKMFPVLNNNNAVARLDVSSTGSVTVVLSNAGWVSLDGISFRIN